MRLTGLARLTGRATGTRLWIRNKVEAEWSCIIKTLLSKRNGLNGNGLAALLDINCRLISRWKLNHKQPSRANLALLRLLYANYRLGVDILKYMYMTKEEIDKEVDKKRRYGPRDKLRWRVRRAKFNKDTRDAVMEMIDTTFNTKKQRRMS